MKGTKDFYDKTAADWAATGYAGLEKLRIPQMSFRVKKKIVTTAVGC